MRSVSPDSPARPPRRMGLFAPSAILLTLALVYGGFWLFASSRVGAAIDAAQASLAARGYQASVGERRIDGFPFRLHLHLGALKIVAPSGWGVEAAGVEAMAYLHDPRHWVASAPLGLLLDRPSQAPVRIVGEALRASVVATDQGPWRVVVEGKGLRFVPTAPDQPFPLTAADRWGLYFKPDPAGSGDTLMLMDLAGARAAPQSAIARLAGDAPFDATIQAHADHAAAFTGQTFGDAARRWTGSGGVLGIDKAVARSALTRLTADPAVLRLDGAGRIEGDLPVHLVQSGAQRGDRADLHLVFSGGKASLGPLRIGPSPKLY